MGADGAVTVKGPDGEVAVGGAAKLLESWPKDVPVPPSATLMLTSCTGTAGQTGFTCLVSGDSADKPADLVAWYEGQMSGWTKTTSADLGTATMTSWSRGPEIVAVSLTTGERTVVAVTYAHE